MTGIGSAELTDERAAHGAEPGGEVAPTAALVLDETTGVEAIGVVPVNTGRGSPWNGPVGPVADDGSTRRRPVAVRQVRSPAPAVGRPRHGEHEEPPILDRHDLGDLQLSEVVGDVHTVRPTSHCARSLLRATAMRPARLSGPVRVRAVIRAMWSSPASGRNTHGSRQVSADVAVSDTRSYQRPSSVDQRVVRMSSPREEIIGDGGADALQGTPPSAVLIAV